MIDFESLSMESGSGEASGFFSDPSCSGSSNTSNDTTGFECNICFELAQDPIITLCGHLYCWPCLYQWLHIHSRCHECPVCKALIEEQKLVPLYGRGKTSTDPRSRSIPAGEIPHRPTGQRPETAPPPDPNQFRQQGFGFTGGFTPAPVARTGHEWLWAVLSGLIPVFLPFFMNVQVHAFHDATVYGTTSGFPYGFWNTFHGGNVHGFHNNPGQGQQSESSVLKKWFLLLGFIVIISLII